MAKAGKKLKKRQDPMIENRRARFDYFIHDTLECGVVLVGSEVKSVRDGKVSLAEGYVRATDEPPDLVLYSINIAEFPPAGAQQHRPVRPRRLLAHKREILRLAKETSKRGMTLVPLKMYFKNGFAKVLVGVAEGKARHDKRQSIAERESRRDIDRAMSKRV
ncbi:MAG: SsrA-binding protein SmpB [Phycisphaeraceae bacterium]|nr:SsrA-binding protein SmpB [Phycisphaeraceae bacterium]